MIRLIVVILLAAGAFWCYNNVDFSSLTQKAGQAVQNEKTIKAVNEKRAFDYELEQSAIKNEN